VLLNRALRLLRAYHDISQKALAQRLDISNAYLSEIEKGDKTASVDLIGKYSEIFKIPISSIMLFAENLEGDAKSKDRLKFAAADKVLRLLEWIDERDEIGQGT
jgi:transcriptional regulator with XRE-family HTH domain